MSRHLYEAFEATKAERTEAKEHNWYEAEADFVRRLDECYKHYLHASTDITNPDYDPDTSEYYRGKAHGLMIARDLCRSYFRDRFLAKQNEDVSREADEHEIREHLQHVISELTALATLL